MFIFKNGDPWSKTLVMTHWWQFFMRLLPNSGEHSRQSYNLETGLPSSILWRQNNSSTKVKIHYLNCSAKAPRNTTWSWKEMGWVKPILHTERKWNVFRRDEGQGRKEGRKKSENWRETEKERGNTNLERNNSVQLHPEDMLFHHHTTTQPQSPFTENWGWGWGWGMGWGPKNRQTGLFGSSPVTSSRRNWYPRALLYIPHVPVSHLVLQSTPPLA